MSKMDVALYSGGDAEEIHRRVLGRDYNSPDQNIARTQTIHNLLYYGILTEDLAAATNPRTGQTFAECRILRYVQPISPTLLDMEDSTTDHGLINVTNRSENFSARVGDLILMIRNGSEWSPLNIIASGTQRHARIAECLGNGYYRATLSVAPAFSIPDQSEAGTGTYSGVGTGSGLFNECDMCSLLYGGSEAVGTATLYAPVTCSSLSQPSRASVPADGDTIYVYDPRKLTLDLHAHVIVSDLGDRVLDPVDPTVGTGTGTAPQYVTLWMVLTGNYPLIAIPHETYECCNNVVYLTKCDHYITEGYYCPGEQGVCPPVGTGTA